MSDFAPLPASDLARAADYARHALAPATLKAYAADWEDFTAWAQGRGVSALPADPTTVAAYLASMAISHAGPTLRRRLSAIGRAHRMKGRGLGGSSPGHPRHADGPPASAWHAAAAGVRHRDSRDQAASRYLRQQPDWPARPGTLAPGLCRGTPPLRAGGDPARAPDLHARWHAAADPLSQD